VPTQLITTAENELDGAQSEACLYHTGYRVGLAYTRPDIHSCDYIIKDGLSWSPGAKIKFKLGGTFQIFIPPLGGAGEFAAARDRPAWVNAPWAKRQ
jgi:hypothetical protein